METNSSISEDDTFEASKQIFRVQGHIDQHCVLLISNLHYDVTEMELEEHFRVAVPIRSLTIFYDGNGISTGKGEIVLYNEEDASTIEVRFGNTKFKRRIMRLESPRKRILDMFFNSVLISNLPEGVTANELKAHFPPAIKARKATIYYNKDGSWTGRGKVVFYDNVHNNERQKLRWLNEQIRGQRMGFAKPRPISFRCCLRETTTLYITDLRHDISTDDLKQCFGASLHVTHATIFYNKDGSSTGTGEVTVYMQEASLASRSSSPSSRSSSSSSRSSSTSSRRSALSLRIAQTVDFIMKTFGFCSLSINTKQNDSSVPMYRWDPPNYLYDHGDDEYDDHFEYYRQRKQYYFKELYEVSVKRRIHPFELEYWSRNLIEVISSNANNQGHTTVTSRPCKVLEKERHRTLYVTNLDYDVTPDELKHYFSTSVPVLRASVLYHRPGISSGTGLVTFYNRNDRLLAFLRFDFQEFKGQMLGLICVEGWSTEGWSQPPGRNTSQFEEI